MLPAWQPHCGAPTPLCTKSGPPTSGTTTASPSPAKAAKARTSRSSIRSSQASRHTHPTSFPRSPRYSSAPSPPTSTRPPRTHRTSCTPPSSAPVSKPSISVSVAGPRRLARPSYSSDGNSRFTDRAWSSLISWTHSASTLTPTPPTSKMPSSLWSSDTLLSPKPAGSSR